MVTGRPLKQGASTVTRDETGRWLPGTAAPNPGGRPSLPEEFKAHGPSALRKLVEFMDDKNRQIAVRAVELVVERIYGKASQPLEHTGQDLLDLVAERIAQRMNGHSDSHQD
mgnify:CR=1 FL=1